MADKSVIQLAASTAASTAVELDLTMVEMTAGWMVDWTVVWRAALLVDQKEAVVD